jgi:lysophospholipase L1-like esterase
MDGWVMIDNSDVTLVKAIILSLLFFGYCSRVGAVDTRVACLGNSITVGVGDHRDDPDTYPAQLDVLLGDGYNVQNFGVSGRTLLKHGDHPIWNEIAFTELLNFKPDIITVSLGTNDSKPWNWVYKDEFVPDYIALIDTFRTLDSNPIVYPCLPPPVFKEQDGIRDSVITTDIIPMIHQVAERKGTEIIDFYTPLMDKGALFPDGIHPDKDGWWIMAQIVCKNLIGKEVQEITDVNLALNAGVLTPKSSAFPGDLVDGNPATFWPCQVGESVVVDLGSVQSVDLFHVHFGETAAYRYTIETSLDNMTWDMASDQSARRGSLQVAADGIGPRDVQYVRFTLVTAGEGRDRARLAELCVLRSAPVHAPVLSYRIDRFTEKDARIDLNIISTGPGGYLKYYTKNAADAPYTAATGYRPGDAKTVSVTIRPSSPKSYYAKFYKERYEAASEPLVLDYSLAAVDEKSAVHPNRFELDQNYPNPFNAETRITFALTRESDVSIGVYNIKGQWITTLAEKSLPAGRHAVSWNGRGHQGRLVPSGVYFYRLRAGDDESTRKMLFVR